MRRRQGIAMTAPRTGESASSAGEARRARGAEAEDEAEDQERADKRVADQAVAMMDDARAAFKAGDYSTALNQTDHAIEKMPNDPSLHEFRVLVLFAIGQYDAAASALYPVLSTGPGWDWTTMVGLYPNVDVYTQQLNDLKADVKNRPNTAQGHFVLAYHYLTQGYPDNARAELREVVRLQPGDMLSAKLLSQLSPPPSHSSPSPPTSAASFVLRSPVE